MYGLYSEMWLYALSSCFKPSALQRAVLCQRKGLRRMASPGQEGYNSQHYFLSSYSVISYISLPIASIVLGKELRLNIGEDPLLKEGFIPTGL